MLSRSPQPHPRRFPYPPAPKHHQVVLTSETVAGSSFASVSAYEHPTTPRRGGTGHWSGFPDKSLLRKEVIQPHLPVRLPCYDFVPIASPTFDHSLPEGLGHGLRVLPTFVT